MAHAEEHEGTRRDFIYYATASAGAVTAGAAIWPLVNQMNPSADVKALSSIRVDVADLAPGTQLTVKWLGKPVFIRRRTEDEIKEARAVDLSELIDTSARNNNAPALDAADKNRAKSHFPGLFESQHNSKGKKCIKPHAGRQRDWPFCPPSHDRTAHYSG